MKHFILTIGALMLCLFASAQSIRPEWDVRFKAAVINDEFDISNCILAPSGTLAAFNFSPYAGIGFGEGHRVKVGLNVQKDFGTQGDKPKAEFAAWYQYNSKNGFTLAAGIFPFALMGGRYSTLIFSDESAFNDIHCDGFLLRWQRERSNYEIALDWNGKYGATRREEFYFVSAGEGWVTPWLALCWEGSFHHYACSEAVDGVVDDHLLHPYLQFEFSSVLPMDRFEVSLGAVGGYQMDRRIGERKLPLGADLVVDVAKWGFGIRNQFYYGENQMPFFHEKDAAGVEYGKSLYFRSSWWQIRRDDVPTGLYNRLDAYWTKSFGQYVSLGIHAVFHFDHLGLLGSQQFLQANVNLEALPFWKKKK